MRVKMVFIASILFFFLLAIVLLNNMRLSGSARSNYDELNRATLTMVRQGIVAQEGMIRSLLVGVAEYRVTIRQAYLLAYQDTREQQEYFQHIIDTLKVIEAENRYVDTTHIEFTKMDKVVSSDGVSSRKIHAESYMLDLSGDALSAFYDGTSAFVRTPGRRKNIYGGGDEQSVFYMYTLNRLYTVQASVSRSSADRFIASLLPDQSLSVYALMADGTIYASRSTLPEPFTAERLHALAASSDTDEVYVGGERYSVLRDTAGDISLVAFFSDGALIPEIQRNTNYLIVLLVCCFVLSVMLFWVLWAQMYRPIHRIVMEYKGGVLPDEDGSGRGDEYRQIDRMLSNMTHHIDSMDRRIRDNELEYQRLMRERIHHVCMSPGELVRYIQDAETCLYGILTVVVEDRNGVLQPRECRSFIEQLSEDNQVSLLFTYGQSFTCFVRLERGLWPTDVLGRLVDQWNGRDFCLAGISQVHTGLMNVLKACEESRTALDMTPVERRRLVVYDEVMNAKRRRFQVDIRWQTQMAALLSNGYAKETREYLVRVFDENSDLPIYQQQRLSGYLVDLSYILAGSNNISLERDENIETWIGSHNVAFLRQCVITRYECISASMLNGGDALMRRIYDYIDAHVSEPVTLQDLEDVTGRSSGYLSTYFKSHAGIGFSAYLMRARMERAKAMLTSSDLSVMAIASAVGYDSASTFGRVFKKETGASPGQYRDMHRAQ